MFYLEKMTKRVLVVEDEKLIAGAIQKKLLASGFEVEVAFDGEDGLKKALSLKPDMILLDIVLPKMDGITVLDNLRADEWGKTAAVIILTNLDTDFEYNESRARGVTDYLVKTSWSLDDVISKIHERIGE